MPTTPINTVIKNKAVQYTGSNSAAISALITNTFTVSESGGVWIVESPPGSSTWTVHANDWILYTQNMIMQTATPAEFAFYWDCNAVCADLTAPTASITALQTSVTALQVSVSSLTAAIAALNTTPAVRSEGVAAVPVILLNNSATIAVTLNPAMPSTSFTAKGFVFAGVALTGVSITSVTVISASIVNVVVQNSGLVSLAGASVLVTATS